MEGDDYQEWEADPPVAPDPNAASSGTHTAAPATPAPAAPEAPAFEPSGHIMEVPMEVLDWLHNLWSTSGMVPTDAAPAAASGAAPVAASGAASEPTAEPTAPLTPPPSAPFTPPDTPTQSVPESVTVEDKPSEPMPPEDLEGWLASQVACYNAWKARQLASKSHFKVVLFDFVMHCLLL